jgi:hypothetical protein
MADLLSLAFLALRLLIVAARLWHNEMIARPGRELAAYGQ